MPRQKNIDQKAKFQIYLPQSLALKMELELYSMVEGRVPFGAKTELFTELVSNWLRDRGVEV